MNEDSVKFWPKSEQPREKLLSKGAGSLSDAELLAIFLRNGPPGKNVMQVSRELLKHFGGLRPLLSASHAELGQFAGLGPAKIVLLKACVELSKRHWQEKLVRGQGLKCAETTKHFLLTQLRDKEHEVFACLYLDNQNQMIAFEELFRGTLTRTEVYPREVVKRALALNAAAIIFAHNHPSGCPEPSAADLKLTILLTKALKLVGVKVLDHIVVGDGEVASFAEYGLLAA